MGTYFFSQHLIFSGANHSSFKLNRRVVHPMSSKAIYVYPPIKILAYNVQFSETLERSASLRICAEHPAACGTKRSRARRGAWFSSETCRGCFVAAAGKALAA
jgi:hypothetical protein